MKKLIYIAIMLTGLLLYSCHSEMKTRKRIESLLKSGQSEKYMASIACIRYISQPESDVRYSKYLVKQLLALGFFPESIDAAEELLKRYPEDPELYYLKGQGYRQMLQYGLAEENLIRACKLQTGNKTFSSQALAVQEEERVWKDIQTLDMSLTSTNDSFSVLLNRAETFFRIKQYDAVLYDLGSLSKMGSRNDSLYFANSVSSLYQGGGRKSVEILTDMLEYFRTEKEQRSQNAQ